MQAERGHCNNEAAAYIASLKGAIRMRIVKRIFVTAVMAMSMYIFTASPLCAWFRQQSADRLEAGRMCNVSYTLSTAVRSDIPMEEAVPALARACVPASGVKPEPAPAEEERGEPEKNAAPASPAPETPEPAPEESEIKETNIEGGLSIKNLTNYEVDMGKILMGGPQLTLPCSEPQILIIHTHSSEAYTMSGLDSYEPSDDKRTEDTRYNIVRIGDEMAKIFESAGLNVIHDREIYDYPSYTGSYSRSGRAVEEWLAQYPGISVVFDVHRDALGENGVVYKTMAEEEGVCASQLMLLAGTDESGLEHPDWRKNLSLAVYLQQAVNSKHPTLMRPVELVPQRYNQHLTPGSLILEVGSSGNTLQEALAGIRLFSRAAAPALAALTVPAE